MRLKSFIIATAIGAASMAQAECYVRSSTLTESRDAIEKIADAQNTFVRLSSGQMRCTSTFRVLIKGTWHTAEGQAIVPEGTSEAQACARAQNSGKITILQQVSGKSLTLQEETVCTDQNLPKTRTVKEDEIVRESEVVPDPAWPNTKRMRDGNVCRKFVESDMRGVEMRRTRGVICQVSETDWKVVEKY
jgi:hypothetical protein